MSGRGRQATSPIPHLHDENRKLTGGDRQNQIVGLGEANLPIFPQITAVVLRFLRMKSSGGYFHWVGVAPLGKSL